MATLVTNIGNLATRIASENKSLRTLLNGNAADLSSLTTTAKSNVVVAINELKGRVDGLQAASGAQIDDATASTTKTYSSSKINSAIAAGIASVVDTAPTTLDTLKELATALGNDANYAATTAAALGNRVRTDGAQTITTTQRNQVKTNLDILGVVEIGTPDTDFVATFNAGLV